MTEIRVVFDTTALLAYATLKGTSAAELVMVVEDDEGESLIGIPAACYMAAHSQLDDHEQLALETFAMRIDGVTVILPLSGADAVEAARLGHTMGHALVEVMRRPTASLATFDAAAGRFHLPGSRVLDLGEG